MTVHRPQFAVFIGPFIPDTHAMVFEIFDVGVAGDEPKQFIDDGFQVYFLGGQQRETVLKVKPHLVSEQAGSAGAGPVTFDHAFRVNMS